MTNKRRGNPNWKKGGASPNPAGRPKDGASWAAIIKSVGDMYPADIIAFVGNNNDLGKMLENFPDNVQMKYLVTARIFASLMFEPTSGLWKELMERVEGKVQDRLDLSNTDGSLNENFVYNRVMERVQKRLAGASTSGTKKTRSKPAK